MTLKETKTHEVNSKSKVVDEWGRFGPITCHNLWELGDDQNGDTDNNNFIAFIIVIVIKLHVFMPDSKFGFVYSALYFVKIK